MQRRAALRGELWVIAGTPEGAGVPLLSATPFHDLHIFFIFLKSFDREREREREYSLDGGP
jgi:hypothetical protein